MSGAFGGPSAAACSRGSAACRRGLRAASRHVPRAASRHVLGLAVAANLGLAGACDAPTIPERRLDDTYAFTLPTATGDTLVLRWPQGSVVRVWAADADAGAPLRAAFEAGAALWNERALFGEYRLVAAAAPAEADILLAWAPGPLPVDTEACPPLTRRGTTTFCLRDQDGRRRLDVFPLLAGEDHGQVRMLVTFLREAGAPPADLAALVAHELGHVLGLTRHSPNPLDLMYESPGMPPALSLRDAATVQVLYHTRADIVP
ncbi:MAG: matrixin family metalloprotease [Gemmatimonadota bacterium]